MPRSEGDGPSVTQVLELSGLGPDLERIPGPVLERARQRGTEAHHVIELHHKGQLDEAFIGDDVRPYWKAWQTFLFVTHFELVSAEETIQRYGDFPYHGRYDLLAHLDGDLWLLDIKTSHTVNKRYCFLQLGAYARGADPRPSRAGVLHLRKDSTYRLIELTKEAFSEAATEAFDALLLAWHCMDRYDKAMGEIN